MENHNKSITSPKIWLMNLFMNKEDLIGCKFQYKNHSWEGTIKDIIFQSQSLPPQERMTENGSKIKRKLAVIIVEEKYNRHYNLNDCVLLKD